MKITLAAILFLGTSVLAHSSDLSKEQRQKEAEELLQKGITAYQQDKYQEAAQYYALSIQKWASVRALANLCNLYLYGQGVEKDYASALELCRPAAEADDPHALVMMGEMHLFGRGVPTDRNKAMNYYKKGAEQGHVHGQYVLGSLLAESDSREDWKKAIFWLQKASQQNHQGARKLLEELMQKANKRLETDSLRRRSSFSLEFLRDD